MKSFFALVTAVTLALAVVPSALANPVPESDNQVPPTQPLHLFSKLPGNLVFGAAPSFFVFPPISGSQLIMTRPGNGSATDYNAWVLSAGTDRGFGHIQLENRGAFTAALCITARGTGNHVATVDACNDSDPEQQWFVGGSDPTTIATQDGRCLTLPNASPKPADQVTVTQCQSPVTDEQRWNAVAA